MTSEKSQSVTDFTSLDKTFDNVVIRKVHQNKMAR